MIGLKYKKQVASAFFADILSAPAPARLFKSAAYPAGFSGKG